MTYIIESSQLSKEFRIRESSRSSYVSLREKLASKFELISSFTDRGINSQSGSSEFSKFKALDNVSFSIEPGEKVGIIGRNGAGKSTLLKVLSRITYPSSGEVVLRGRVASLLEVGTGFHPELSGRENIYLNGAILGMSRKEIKQRFDDIVDFSEVSRFLDTPVKRYSSGMYVRLAFSVAAHLDQEVLIIDEVLAVGDAAFQEKCLEKMSSVSKSGKTVIFVSHNMGAIAELCDRAILLDKGSILYDGDPDSAIRQYLSVPQQTRSEAIIQNPIGEGFPIYISRIHLESTSGEPTSTIPLGQDGILKIEYVVKEDLSDLTLAFLLSRNGSQLLYSYDRDMSTDARGSKPKGHYVSKIRVPLSRFKEGIYAVEVKVGLGKDNLTDERAAIQFVILNTSMDTTHKSFRDERPGHLYWPILWESNPYSKTSSKA